MTVKACICVSGNLLSFCRKHSSDLTLYTICLFSGQRSINWDAKGPREIDRENREPTANRGIIQVYIVWKFESPFWSQSSEEIENRMVLFSYLLHIFSIFVVT